MASDPANDPVSQLAAVASGIASDTAALGALAPQVKSLSAANALAGHQIAALAAWIEAQNPGAVVSMLVRDPYISVNTPPIVAPSSTSIVIYPTLGQLMAACGIGPGSSFNINYQGAPDNTYPWNKVPQTRVYEEVAHSNGVFTEEVVFQDRFMVPTVTNTTTISTSFSSVDSQVSLGLFYGGKQLVYLLANPIYSGYATAIANAGGTSAAALQMMTTVVNAVCSHLKGKVQGYVIFNELIQFGGYNSNAFVTAMGTSFVNGAVAKCIDLIHAADPAAEIWLNTNHVETDGAGDPSGWTFFLNQGIGLKNAGHALTGLSFESHLLANVGNNAYTQFTSRCNAALAAGLLFALGEPDVTDNTLLSSGPAGVAARDTNIASIFGTFLKAALAANQKPAHIIPWQWTDGTSWLSSPPGTIGTVGDRQVATTDGDSWTVGGHTYFTHEFYPTGAAQTCSANTLSATVNPTIAGTLTDGTAVTYTKGLTGGNVVVTGSLVVNGTVSAGARVLTLRATTMSGTTVEGSHARPTIAFDEAGNLKPSYFTTRQVLTAACPGGVAPSSSEVAVQGGTQRYYVAMLDQSGNLVSPQPTFQINSSNTGAATVPNNPTSVGLNSTFLATTTGNGATNITATARDTKGVLVTSNTMVLQSSGFPGFAFPNLPSGMAEVSFRSGVTAAAGSESPGPWGTNTGSTNLSTVTDATVPWGGPSVTQITYPTGFAAGNTPTFNWCLAPGGHGYKRMYWAFAWKMQAGFVFTASAVNKIFYGKPTQGSNTYLAALDQGNGTFQPQFRTQPPGPTNLNLAPNVVPGFVCTLGSWYIWEVAATLNTQTVSPYAGGAVDIWITDSTGLSTHTHSYTGVGITSRANDTWAECDFQPYWGGAGGTVPANQFAYLGPCAIFGGT